MFALHEEMSVDRCQLMCAQSTKLQPGYCCSRQGAAETSSSGMQ